MGSRIGRLLGSVLALAVFYWGIVVSPPASMVVGSARAAPALTPEESRALAERAQALAHAGRYREALQPYLQLHAAYPGSHVFMRALAEAYGHLDQPREEARYWEQFLVHAPTPYEACPQVGLAYEKQERFADGLRAYERCYELDQQNPDFIFFLAHAYERAQNARRARELYRRGLELAPEYSDLALGLARLELHDGHSDVAARAASKVLATSPDNVDALLVAGIASLRLGRLDDARAHLDRGTRLAPKYLDFQLTLAQVAEQQRQPDRARTLYDQVLAIDPRNEQARAGRARLVEKAS